MPPGRPIGSYSRPTRRGKYQCTQCGLWKPDAEFPRIGGGVRLYTATNKRPHPRCWICKRNYDREAQRKHRAG